MPKWRLVFSGDDVYTEKVARVHKLTQEVETAIDNIPGVVDDANSSSTTDALSARMGKVLQDQVTELRWVGTYMSGWDCTTWLPLTEPATDPYTYKTWNYYIVANVSSWGTNYKPHWNTYTQWVPSTEVETDTVSVNDWYMFDWSTWVRQPAWARAITVDDALSNSSTNPVENRVVTWALATKQNTITDLSTIRSWAAAWATALQPWDNISELTNNVWFATTWDVASAVGWAVNNTSYWSWWSWDTTHAPSKDAAYDVLETKQDKLIAWTNITIAADWKTISAWDTTYSTATSSTAWLVKLGSDTAQSVAANAVSATANRTYAVQLNSSDQMVVNVPWVNDDTQYSTATSNVAWIVKLWDDTVQVITPNTVSATADRTYAVQLNSNWQMLVNVPWTDTNTTYSAWSWINITNGEVTVDTTTIATKTYADWAATWVVSDTAFWASWDWDTTHAPSKNAVYDVLWDVETLLANI